MREVLGIGEPDLSAGAAVAPIIAARVVVLGRPTMACRTALLAPADSIEKKTGAESKADLCALSAPPSTAGGSSMDSLSRIVAESLPTIFGGPDTSIAFDGSRAASTFPPGCSWAKSEAATILKPASSEPLARLGKVLVRVWFQRKDGEGEVVGLNAACAP